MPGEHDDYDLERFVEAQNGGVFDRALAELKAGRKTSHWMWFVFPQPAGLGSSVMSQRYAIQSTQEAAAYLAHPLLGSRLRRCAEAMLAVPGKSAHDILGYPDDLKFRSSMTLFAAVSEPASVFHQAIDRYFDGIPDRKTVALIEAHGRYR
ncbi:DUF1810 domain-containing protein [Rhizobium sp. RAF56]|jgi:uncharacterized protein (DUF1810 family)|uniref:DUF1810 domain-containing protein n=1 Tax=Rhizobium sp. RAF56 TaxID=3233062 RepID=UPI003F9848B0